MTIFIDLSSPIITAVSGTPIPLLSDGNSLIWLGGSLIGMALTDLLFGDDEDDESNIAEGPANDDPFLDEGASEGGDELGDLDGMEEGFEDLGNTGGTQHEQPDLEPRIEELENEVVSISSTISTVRSENEEIAESVDNMEENIRKLLDIYEMVTRGVNPFVDEVQQGSGLDNDTFDLFDTNESDETDEDDSELDAEIASADAESFFDDDFQPEQPETPQTQIEDGADTNDFDPFNDETDTGEPSQPEANGENDAGGLTFEELKEEYEAGEAEWTDEQLDDTQPEESEQVPSDSELFEQDDDTPRQSHEEATESSDAPDDADESDAAGSNRADSESSDSSSRNEDNGRKPYLVEVPAGFNVELLVMEWLEFLTANSDLRTAIAAIEYYENMEWISDQVATDLNTAISGLGSVESAQPEKPIEARTDGAGVPGLSIEHHRKSLEYISQLTGGQFQPGSFQMNASGGTDDGV